MLYYDRIDVSEGTGGNKTCAAKNFIKLMIESTVTRNYTSFFVIISDLFIFSNSLIYFLICITDLGWPYLPTNSSSFNHVEGCLNVSITLYKCS